MIKPVMFLFTKLLRSPKSNFLRSSKSNIKNTYPAKVNMLNQSYQQITNRIVRSLCINF